MSSFAGLESFLSPIADRRKVALLPKRIPVGAKEESWVSAEEILKSLLRDYSSTKSTIVAFVYYLCLF